MKIDFSKGVSLHRLYGHDTFMVEATKQKKSDKFMAHICASLKCDGTFVVDWRNHLYNKF